jgi:hypothetical protein
MNPKIIELLAVVESARVVPIAFGLPALLALLLFWRRRPS